MTTDTTAIPLPDDITTAVNSRLFAAVAAFRAKDDIRFYLTGVHITPCPESGGVIIVATDGHQMAVAHDPEGRAAAPVIWTCSAGLASAARSKGQHSGHVVLQGERLRGLSSSHEERYVQPGPVAIEAKFPDFTAVFPGSWATLTAGANGSFAARLMERLNKIARELSPKYSALDHQTSDDGKLITRFATEPNLIALTMPMRGDPMPAELPAAIARAVELGTQARHRAAELEAATKAADAATRVNTDAEVGAEAQPA